MVQQDKWVTVKDLSQCPRVVSRTLSQYQYSCTQNRMVHHHRIWMEDDIRVMQILVLDLSDLHVIIVLKIGVQKFQKVAEASV